MRQSVVAVAVTVLSYSFTACRSAPSTPSSTSSSPSSPTHVAAAPANVVAPSGYVDPRLAAHRAQLEKLAGAKIVAVEDKQWRHRRDERAAAAATAHGKISSGARMMLIEGAPSIGGGGAAGSALGGLTGASMGDASGSGGLGLRGSGAGGGGTGEATTSEPPPPPPPPPPPAPGKVVVKSEKIEILGRVAKPDVVGRPAPPSLEDPALAEVSDGDVVLKKRTVIDFDDVALEGELAKPEGSYVKSRKKTSYPDLVEGMTGKKLARAEVDRALPRLRAGSTDDNADFDAFLRFVDETMRERTPASAMNIDVRGRRFIRVVDGEGRALPTAEIVVRDARVEAVVATASTYGDGRAPFYAEPRRDTPITPSTAGPGYIVEVAHGGRAVAAQWSGDDELVVRMPTSTKPGPVPVDALFILDTTGSMSDEIEQIKSTLLEVTRKVRGLSQGVDLRWGAVLYRDVGDEYVTSTFDFTWDAHEFDAALANVRAEGGGDLPESLNQGLSEGMVGVHWRPNAAKVAFLIADAPPHMDYEDDVSYGESLKDAVTLGVRVHAVAASGLDESDGGSLVFRQIAQYARGRFIFIEYGGDVAASGAAHGVASAKKSNNLDDILYREIEREVNEWAR